MPVLLLATLDTKGTEAAFLRDRLSELGVDVRVVDTGCLGQPAITPDITRNEFYA
ncbi:MAG: Tm-1-like ATP-binding domain-containing protein, partial [Planctomycetota bacterium]|nr:Tm-1-like ATP-binding domain-containing protein [Planctomycetota bacterium]